MSKRRKRTSHLIKLGGLVIKAGIVEPTSDPAMIYGALPWMADKLHSEHIQRARELWAAKGRCTFAGERLMYWYDGPRVDEAQRE